MASLREQWTGFRALLANPPRPDATAWLGLSAVLIAVDQWTKWLALTHLEFGRAVTVVDGFWNWMLVYNYGAAFSFLADAGGWQKWVFAALAVVVSGAMAVWLRVTPRGDWRTALPLALVVAGALGNLVDRVRLGKVVDFVDWYAGSYHWPAFNVADACIVAGAIGLVVFSFRTPPAGAEGG
jgi:signal peptidase II